ncbi:MAG: AIR synthase related protein, partial [Candidatus Omnitrophota bacterium]
MEKITISHGSGGKLTDNLIKDIFFKYLGNEILAQKDDAALVTLDSKDIAFSTDSFVIKPVFFPGGDIGKLAICGTVNDLAVNGAVAEYISCGFIIEEGFAIADLEKIVKSMGECVKEAGVKIVCGDTKVVEKGAADGLFINTAGIGRVVKKDSVLGVNEISTGDKVIITGNIAE